MPKEVVTIHTGQAGVQMGSALWELYCIEHGVTAEGKLKDTKEPNLNDRIETLFCESNGQYVPRTVFVDLEPTVIDEIKSGSYKNLFSPSSLLKGNEDAANNYSRGFYTIGKDKIDAIMDSVRKVVNNCESVAAFQIMHSYAGGTGSGLTSLLLLKLSETYGKKFRVSVGIFPSSTMSQSTVDPYNSLLHTHGAIEHIDCGILFDNESLYRKAINHLCCARPTYSLMNRLISQMVTCVFLSHRYRYEGTHHIDVDELLTNLVPYPRIHFPVLSYAPIVGPEQIKHEKIDVSELTRNVFNGDAHFLDCAFENNKYLSCCLLYRGYVSPRSVYDAVAKVKCDRNISFVDWCPTGFKLGLNTIPPIGVPNLPLATPTSSLCMVSGNVGIREAWKRDRSKFDLIFNKRAFVHWFVGEGLEEGEFLDSREDIVTLENDYEEIARDSDEVEKSTTERPTQTSRTKTLSTQMSTEPKNKGPISNTNRFSKASSSGMPLKDNSFVSQQEKSKSHLSAAKDRSNPEMSGMKDKSQSRMSNARESPQGRRSSEDFNPQVRLSSVKDQPQSRVSTVKDHPQSRASTVKDHPQSRISSVNPQARLSSVQDHPQSRVSTVKENPQSRASTMKKPSVASKAEEMLDRGLESSIQSDMPDMSNNAFMVNNHFVYKNVDAFDYGGEIEDPSWIDGSPSRETKRTRNVYSVNRLQSFLGQQNNPASIERRSSYRIFPPNNHDTPQKIAKVSEKKSADVVVKKSSKQGVSRSPRNVMKSWWRKSVTSSNNSFANSEKKSDGENQQIDNLFSKMDFEILDKSVSNNSNSSPWKDSNPFLRSDQWGFSNVSNLIANTPANQMKGISQLSSGSAFSSSITSFIGNSSLSSNSSNNILRPPSMPSINFPFYALNYSPDDDSISEASLMLPPPPDQEDLKLNLTADCFSRKYDGANYVSLTNPTFSSFVQPLPLSKVTGKGRLPIKPQTMQMNLAQSCFFDSTIQNIAKKRNLIMSPIESLDCEATKSKQQKVSFINFIYKKFHFSK